MVLVRRVPFGFCWSENRCSTKSSSKYFYVHYGEFWWGRLSVGSLFPRHAVSLLAVDRLISLTPPVPFPVSLSALCGFVFISELEKHAARPEFLQSKPGWNTEISNGVWNKKKKAKNTVVCSENRLPAWGLDCVSGKLSGLFSTRGDAFFSGFRRFSVSAAPYLQVSNWVISPQLQAAGSLTRPWLLCVCQAIIRQIARLPSASEDCMCRWVKDWSSSIDSSRTHQSLYKRHQNLFLFPHNYDVPDFKMHYFRIIKGFKCAL